MKSFLLFWLRLVLALAVGIVLNRCSSSTPGPVVDPAAVAPYLTWSLRQQDQVIAANLQFYWDRATKSPSSPLELVNLAGTYLKRFQRNGAISDLILADSLLVAAERLPGGRSLNSIVKLKAASAVNRHQFAIADSLLRSLAETSNEPAGEINLLLADVQLERGRDAASFAYIQSLPTQDLYDVMVRKAKYFDQVGEGDSSLYYLKRAHQEAFSNPGLINSRASISANLADAQSHHGEFAEAAQGYLKALSLDSNHYHALSGLARLALRVDRNPELAERILNFVAEHNRMLDHWLDLAEVAESLQQAKRSDNLVETFVATAERPEHRGLYETYLIDVYTERLNQPARAVALAEAMVRQRPSAMAYHYLAWAAHCMGDTGRAIRLIEEKVIELTHEPLALLRIGLILKSHDPRQSRHALEAARAGTYELGERRSRLLEQAL